MSNIVETMVRFIESKEIGKGQLFAECSIRIQLILVIRMVRTENYHIFDCNLFSTQFAGKTCIK